jgi:hypothetical protein
MKLPLDMTGVTAAGLVITQHETDKNRFIVAFHTNRGHWIEEEFTSERAAIRAYKRMYKAIQRTRPSHEYKYGWAADLV